MGTEKVVMWMIRGGQGAAYIEDFKEKGVVAIGWQDMGELPQGTSREQLMQRGAEAYPDDNRSKLANLSGQIYRFLNEVKIGDKVVSYDPSRRVYLLGTVQTDPAFSPGIVPELPRVRQVTWEHEVPRDLLSTSTKNSIGAISTLFLIPEAAAQDILSVAEKGVAVQEPSERSETQDDEQDLLGTIRAQAKEFIKDRINRLDGYQLQDLVAGVLRAMGYKTRVAPPGSDRGVDILASPDGFGFESPRIVVECKHRQRSAIGSQDIRSFLGGRHKDDKGLFVSTGGFTREARYEAERASIPLTLMDLDQLVEAVVEHYETLDSESRVLLPLTKLYWPLD